MLAYIRHLRRRRRIHSLSTHPHPNHKVGRRHTMPTANLLTWWGIHMYRQCMKKLNYLTAALATLFTMTSIAHADRQPQREVALTFDDCPRSLGGQMTGMERARKLNDGLKAAGIQAAFFCNSPSRQPDGPQRIQFFADQGHIIANHTANHPHLKNMTSEEFIRDIAQADQELRGFPNFRKWLRFPFLDEGVEPKEIIAVRDYLARTGYRNGYVTVNIEDWYANQIFLRALAAGKKWDQSKLCKTYVKIITDEVEFYDRLAIKALGRSVKHVALLHETDINALCISNIIQSLHDKKWTFISPDEAYSDPIATQEPPVTVKLNMGRVYALAKAADYKGPYQSKWTKTSAIEAEFKRRKVFY